MIYLSQSLDLGLIDWRRPLIWSSQSQEIFLIRFSDQPYFGRFKKTCYILSQVLLSCHIPLLSNLCWMKLFFYLRWHVFYSAKKENETIVRNDIRLDHVTGWPYFGRFKKLGGKKWKLPAPILIPIRLLKSPYLQANEEETLKNVVVVVVVTMFGRSVNF